MHPILEFVTDRLGPRPRRFRREEWPDLIIPEPPWAGEDEIGVVFRDQRFLYEEGEVVWGVFVQANRVLSRPGPGNHPGTLIYSRDPEIDEDPELLQRFARRLARLREDGSDDPDEDRYGRMLADEMMRAMRWRAPERLTEGLPVFSTSVMVCRDHIPGRILVRTKVPILRHRDTVATLIVPHWFWPKRYREDWADRAAEMIAEHPQWASVSQAAVGRWHQIIAENKVKEPWCVRVWIERPHEGTQQVIKVEIDLDFDNDRDKLIDTSGVTIAFARQQADQLRGIDIDYFDNGHDRGFIVG